MNKFNFLLHALATLILISLTSLSSNGAICWIPMPQAADTVVCVDDNSSVNQDGTVEILVQSNDSVACTGSAIISIITPPTNGNSVSNLSGAVDFTPNTGVCGPDSFEYQICCDPSSCDSAWVFVDVICDPITTTEISIYNALSPDGDGANDYWIIEGAATCQIEIQIFNRYGNLIYEDQDYRNNWSGTWQKSGEAVPDGTYYYVLQVRNCSDAYVITQEAGEITTTGNAAAIVGGYLNIYRGN